ncbi:hypothetical protein SHAQ108633_15985 [Shewanella aquimarina]
MPTITCSNDECGKEIEFSHSDLKVEDSEQSGNHTTQYSASGKVSCNNCNSQTKVSCVWDELNDTGEILSFDFT